jgi:hypothetical protein
MKNILSIFFYPAKLNRVITTAESIFFGLLSAFSRIFPFSFSRHSASLTDFTDTKEESEIIAFLKKMIFYQSQEKLVASSC